MKSNEMNGIRKVALIICILCAIVGIGLTIYQISVASETIRRINEIVDVIFWVSGAVTFWKKHSLFFIFNIAMAVISLIVVFI